MVQEKIRDDAVRYMLAFAPQYSGSGSDFSGWMNDLDRVINGHPAGFSLPYETGLLIAVVHFPRS